MLPSGTVPRAKIPDPRTLQILEERDTLKSSKSILTACFLNALTIIYRLQVLYFPIL